MTMLILFTIGLTVAAYTFSRWLFLKYPFPLTNPVFVSTALIIVVLTLLHLDFSHYQPGLQIMTFLLGPATVALAVPLYRKREVLTRHLGAVCLGVAAGSLATILSVALMARLFALTEPILLSLLPKSVTVPIAIEIVSIIGGDPALTAAFVVSTGLAGAMFGPTVMNWLKITYPTFWRTLSPVDKEKEIEAL
jgi:putative effector of murein hydrolase